MKIQTRSQKMANAVFHNKIQIDEKLRSVALSFPTMVLQSGLAQSISFLEAKTSKASDKSQSEHYKQLEWIAKSLQIPDLEKEARTCDLGRYRQLTRDVLEAAMWIKRHVQTNS